MAEVLLFHHAQGLTPGVVSFADRLREAGHVVHTPDLYAGRTFDGLDDGVAHAEELGFDNLLNRGVAVADRLPDGIVYAGFSLGVMPAQKLAMTRPGAKGALLFQGAVPLTYFGGTWPAGVPLQIHTNDAEGFGDVAEAREVVQAVPGAELFVYDAKGHLFADSSLPAYDEKDADLLTERVLSFLEKI
jgi:dienelactone hydrolase